MLTWNASTTWAPAVAGAAFGSATIFTTNYFADATVDGPRLSDRIGDRLRSRLHEMTELVSIKGAPDHRITSKMKQNTI